MKKLPLFIINVLSFEDLLKDFAWYLNFNEMHTERACGDRGPGQRGSVCYSLLPHSPLNKLCGPNAYRTLNQTYKALVGCGSGPKEMMPV